jgi:Cof subfamily protein (haloacid dehalogenase superfamily)
MYKLIAVDMDGTLLREDKTVSEETIRAIKAAKSMGVRTVLATGRPVAGIDKYLKELNLVGAEDYAIAFNGALVQNTATNKVLFSKTLSREDLSYLHTLASKLNTNMHAFTTEGCITPRMSKYTQVEATINNIEVEIVNFDEVSVNTEIIKFMMVDEEKVLNEAFNNLPKEVFEKYTVVRSCPYFLEFLNKDCNKGEGVKTLAQHLGIDISEVICVGDAGNDFHMIKYAGLGVAMGNAFPEIKEIADFITHSNNEDGVAHVINKFILAN